MNGVDAGRSQVKVKASRENPAFLFYICRLSAEPLFQSQTVPELQFRFPASL